MIQTLADLRERVKAWSNRKDLSNDLIDDFINIAQARANRILRIPPFEVTATITLRPNGNAVIPNDYIESKEMKVATSSMDITLERKDIHFVEELRRTTTGTPLYFARKGDEFVLAPAPQNITQVELYYYAALNSLSNDYHTNWLVTDAPEMLMYGALSELNLYVKNPQLAGQWEAKFRAAMEELMKMNDDADWSGSTLSVNLGI